MDYLHALFLAALQGLTEFLPISSSAHLILVPELLGWRDQGLTFDVAVHVGTLLAVLVYLRHTLAAMIKETFATLKGHAATPNTWLAFWVVCATVPVVAVGYLGGAWIEQNLRGAVTIAAATGLFALVLAWSDHGAARNQKTLPELNARHAVWVGLAQALALIPGTSRSGITMTAMLALGYTRVDAARFSFLLAVPAIAASGTLKTIELSQTAAPVDFGLLSAAVCVAAFVAFLCIRIFIQWVSRVGMMPFVIYRLLLSALIVWLVI